ncbi:MAG: Unknown protein [uncultured Sulfurovum sp.]|uniref:Uncharacterized protein n=1 Tax=uncultured Sulfurovum sp. TaxID=269237 RepID=A0A6S6TLX5_9BACT|nr:MAG: Unknown protein [uncultured Sulfurovum sp.]
MKKILLASFIMSSLLLGTSFKKITLEKQNFYVITEPYEEYTSKGTAMRLYIEEKSHHLKSLLSHTLTDATGVCSDKRIEKGAYDLNRTHVTLYTFWDRVGDVEHAPYGARVQQYEILKNNTLKQLYSKIYIESEKKGHNLESGMQFLFNSPQTASEKALFETYIAHMERRYKGTFVFGKEQDELLKNVHKALTKSTQLKWK